MMQKNQRKVLEEAETIKLEQYCLNELNEMVDYRTGEILKSRQYVRQPMVWEDKVPIKPPFGAIVSHTQMQRFMALKDKRRLELFNGCRDIYDMDKGKAFFEQGGIVFPTKMMLKLSLLIERLNYKNVIVTTPLNLSICLRVRHANLHRHLNSLKGLVKVSGPQEGIAQGSIKVEVNPVYGFRYETSHLDYVRRDEVENWYQLKIEACSMRSSVSDSFDDKWHNSSLVTNVF